MPIAAWAIPPTSDVFRSSEVQPGDEREQIHIDHRPAEGIEVPGASNARDPGTRWAAAGLKGTDQKLPSERLQKGTNNKLAEVEDLDLIDKLFHNTTS